MSNSPLVSYTKISPNKTSPRNHKIDTITIHCVVGQLSVESLGNVFAPKERRASSNYGIGYDGRIAMYVEEKDRSWCSSSGANDHRAITIECASDKTHPYAINDKVYSSLIALCVDICKRNGIKELKWKADKSLIGQPDKQNLTVHRWFSNTACPGDYLYNKMGQIAADVNKILSGSTSTPPQPSKEDGGDILYRVQVGAYKVKANAEGMKKQLERAGFPAYITTSVTEPAKQQTPKKSIEEVAREVIAGKWGNGDARKNALTKAGYNYSEVQKLVNQLVKK